MGIPFFDIFLVLFIGLAAAFDLKERRIPNWLVLAAMLGGLLLHIVNGAPGLLDSLSGIGLGVALLFIPFALGWLGAGDVKLVGAIGAVLGVAWVPRVLFYSALAGGLLALLSLTTQSARWSVLKDTWIDVKLFVTSRGAVIPASVGERDIKGVHTIPYGVAIGLGTLVAFYGDPQGYWAGF
jgi:prepilin peptidase CpaA